MFLQGIRRGIPRWTGMENYTKGSIVEQEEVLPLSMGEGGVVMKVVAGSKIRNLLSYALKRLKEPGTSQVLWHGSGKAVYKAINCAEIMKRKVKNLHQITRLYEKNVEEFWEPKVEGLDRLKVNRGVPAVCILLSETPLDSSQLGYQPPGSFAAFWPELSRRSSQGQRSRRPCPQSGAEGTKGATSWKRKKRKQAAGTDSKTASKTDSKMGSKMGSKTDSKTDSKTESKTNSKTDSKTDPGTGGAN